MRLLGCVLTGSAVLLLVSCGGSNKTGTPVASNPSAKESPKESPKELSTAEKLIGVWEVVKSENAPPGALMEFTKDGKMKMTMKEKDKVETMEVPYKVEKDKIVVTIKEGGKEKEDTATIKTLDATKLVIRDNKGKEDEYKRKK